VKDVAGAEAAGLDYNTTGRGTNITPAIQDTAEVTNMRASAASNMTAVSKGSSPIKRKNQIESRFYNKSQPPP
jgi:hypothetical protein